jgi:hypothetical protein
MIPAEPAPRSGQFGVINAMIHLRRASLVGALLTIAALAFAACGGATSTTPTPPAGEVPAGEATPTPAAEATPTPEGGAVVPPGALPTFDLSALTGGIPGVDSYRTTFSIGGELAYESVVVTQPVLSKSIQTYDDGEPSAAFIIIGDEVWTADGPDGEFTAVPAQLGNAMLMAFDPALMMGAFAGADLAGVGGVVGTETKNGVQAHHVRIDPTTAAGFAASMPAGSSIDLWVADAGYLVAWEMQGFEADSNLSIQVTNVNDPSNMVERPD